MSEHQWYYIKSGMIEDETIGPLTEKEFVQQVHAGTIGLKTRVMSPTRTKNGWLELQQIPSCLKVWQQGDAEREERKRQQVEERQRQREQEAQEKAERKRQQAEEKARQQELEAQRRAEEERQRQRAAEERAEQQRRLVAQQPPGGLITQPVIMGELLPAVTQQGAMVSHVPCPFCGEPIQSVAKKCRHCGELLDPTLRAADERKRAAAAPPQIIMNIAGGSATASANATSAAVAGTSSSKKGGCCGCLVLIAIAVIIAIVIAVRYA